MAAPNYDTTSATDWYVDSNRADNTGNGRSWAAAKKDLAAVFAAFADTNEKIIYIKAGSLLAGDSNNAAYSGTNHTNVTLVTALGVNPRDYTLTQQARETTKILNNGTKNYNFYSTKPNWFFKNLTISIGRNDVPSFSFNTGLSGFLGEDIDIMVEPATTVAATSTLITLNGSGTFRRLRLRSHGGRYFSLSGTDTITFNFEDTIFEGDGLATGSCGTNSRTAKVNSYGYINNSNATVNFKRCVDVDANSFGVYVTNGTANIYNSLMFGSAATSGADGISKTTGIVNVYNSELFNYGLPSSLHSSLTLNDNPIFGGNIKIASYARGGFVVPCIDDLGNAALVQSMFAPALALRGLKGSWFVNAASARTLNGQTANYFEINTLPIIRDILSGGVVEIGSHSWSHSPQTIAMTSLGSLAGPAGGTITIDATTITFKNSGGTTLYSQSWDDSTVWGQVFYSNENTTTIRTELSGWSITYATDGTNSMTSGVKIKQLASKTDVSVPCAMTLNANYIPIESSDSKAKLEALLGDLIDPQTGVNYVCKTIATPYGTNDATSREQYKTDAYIGCRCIGATYDLLTDFDLYGQGYIDIGVLWTGLTVGTNDDIAKKRTLGLCSIAAISGKVLYILGHNTVVEYWNPILDALQEFNGNGVTVTSMQLSCMAIRTTPWTYNATNGCSTRTYTGKNDFHILPGSSLIGQGTKIPGITTDIEGNPIYPPYNIAPFGLSDGALGMASVVNDGAPRNNITRLTGMSATINPTDTYQLDDTNSWRVVTGWTAGVANFGFDADGVPIPFTGQQLIDAGTGYQLYCGQKGVAGYVVEQDAESHKKIVKFLRVNTYIDSILYDPYRDYNW